MISTALIVGLISLVYKPMYSVTVNGEFLGYTSNKSKLQKRINEYIESKDNSNVAFIDIKDLPEYSLCLLKKDNQANDEEIFEKVKNSGTTYYEYYAIVVSNEEKYYVGTKDEAEAIINELKSKKSTNINKIAYTQVHSTEMKEFTEKDKVVTALYVKPVVVATSAYATGIITSRFGQRASGKHTGLDIATSTGTTIVAAAAGTVTYSGNNGGGLGNFIKISHGNGVETVYGHCSKLYVTTGQTVAQGEAIAAVGSTGNSTGPHLHLEIRVNGVRQNPQIYLYK